MSTTTFWGDVAECRRLLRHCRQVRDENKNQSPALRVGFLAHVTFFLMGVGLSPAWRIMRGVLPWAVIPLLTVPWWRLLGIPSWLGFVTLMLILTVALGQLVAHTPWKLTTFEALHMPSRRSLFVARLEPWLPWWFWLGLWCTAGLLIANWRKGQDELQAALYLLVGAQVPWLVLALLGTFTLLSRVWGRAWTRGPVPKWFVNMITWVALVFMLPLLFSLFNQIGFRPAQAFHSHLALIGSSMLLLEAGLLGLQVWALDRLEPMRQISMGTPEDPELARRKRERSESRAAVVRPGKLGPAPMLAGRHGLGWAGAYYACFKLWNGGPRGILSRLFQSGLMIYLFFNQLLVILAGRIESAWIWMAPLIIWSAASGSTVLGTNPQRLYLLGVDYRCQLVHRLKTFWMTPALLLVSIGAVMSWVYWDKAEVALTLLALWAGLTLLYEGWFGWPVLMQGRMGCLPQFLVLAAWAGLLMWVDLGWGNTATRVQLFAAPCGVFGLARILGKWWQFDENRLAEMVGAGQP